MEVPAGVSPWSWSRLGDLLLLALLVLLPLVLLLLLYSVGAALTAEALLAALSLLNQAAPSLCCADSDGANAPAPGFGTAMASAWAWVAAALCWRCRASSSTT